MVHLFLWHSMSWRGKQHLHKYTSEKTSEPWNHIIDDIIHLWHHNILYVIPFLLWLIHRYMLSVIPTFHFTIHVIVHRLLPYFLIRIVKMGGIWKVILFAVVDTIIKQLKILSTHRMNVVIEWKFVSFLFCGKCYAVSTSF